MSEERYHRFDGWRTKCEQCNAAPAAWELFRYEDFPNQERYLYLCDVCKEEQ